MSDINFAKGMNVKTVKGDNWEIIKLGIKHDEFYENPINENGYINIVLKRSSRTNNWYAVVDEYKKKEETEEEVKFTDDVIPF